MSLDTRRKSKRHVETIQWFCCFFFILVLLWNCPNSGGSEVTQHGSTLNSDHSLVPHPVVRRLVILGAHTEHTLLCTSCSHLLEETIAEGWESERNKNYPSLHAPPCTMVTQTVLSYVIFHKSFTKYIQATQSTYNASPNFNAIIHTTSTEITIIIIIMKWHITKKKKEV